MTINIQSKSHAYTVETVADLTTALRAAAEPAPFLLVDGRVRALYPDAFDEAQRQGRLITITASEEQKSYERLLHPFLDLIERGLRRHATLCVVGGGVTQDIGCFIASVLFRGIRWVYLPTTLLSQCDSCIGGKSSLNIGPYKNQLGTFYAPHRILLAASVLRTLTDDDLRSGLGEIIKLHLVAGNDAFQHLRATLAARPADPAALLPTILDSLLIKKSYIEHDEFDQGVRNLLNYGHTFGHAIESTTHFAVPHGIAVTLGISAATFLSARLGWISPAAANELDLFLKTYYDPFQHNLCQVTPEALRAALARDKKNSGAGLTCILTRGPGRMEKQTLDMDQQAMPWLLEWLKGRT